MADWRVTDGSYKGLSFHVAIPKSGASYGVISQEVQNERRLQVSERPLVDGADVEDFGRKPRTFTAEVIFFGSDYVEQLKAFETKLNEGTSGTLILPDLSEAVYAKYQRHSRKSSSQEGNCTILSVSWIEDRNTKLQASATTAAQVAQAKLSKGNVAQAIPTIQNQANSIKKFADSVTAKLNSNSLLTSISSAEKAVTNATVKINSVANVPKELRQQILTSVTQMQNKLKSLQASVKGLLHYTDTLNLGLTQSSPTRYNSGLGQIDFTAVDEVTTTVVSGDAQLQITEDAATNIQSFDEAKKQFEDSADGIAEDNKNLENATQGATSEISTANIQLVNSLKDMISILDSSPTTKILVDELNSISLMEVCFRNGFEVSDIDRIYKLNTHLTDILDIPRLTVINL